MEIDKENLQRICRDLLKAIGEDPDREGLQDTPRRWAKWWSEFMNGGPNGTGATLGTTFQGTGVDQLVVVNGIEAWSLCEHHLLPFKVTVSVGYITDSRVLGLSKFARIIHDLASRPQVQERLTEEIASKVSELTGSKNVAVQTRGYHLCMAMRGIRTPATMITQAIRGVFLTNDSARAEFLALTSKDLQVH
jgi:GTP cyclohydrolase I